MFGSGRFRVSEFRIPLMQGAVTPPKAPQVAPREVLLSLSLGYLSGGPASGHPVKLTALVRNRDSHYPDYAEFTFGTGFDRDDDKDAEGRTQNAGDRLVVDRNALSLGPDGTARFVVKDLPKVDRPRELLAEMTYRDPNGEEQTLRGVAALWPAGVVAGTYSSTRPMLEGISALPLLNAATTFPPAT